MESLFKLLDPLRLPRVKGIELRRSSLELLPEIHNEKTVTDRDIARVVDGTAAPAAVRNNWEMEHSWNLVLGCLTAERLDHLNKCRANLHNFLHTVLRLEDTYAK